jgi:hypothetical protein
MPEAQMPETGAGGGFRSLGHWDLIRISGIRISDLSGDVPAVGFHRVFVAEQGAGAKVGAGLVERSAGDGREMIVLLDLGQMADVIDVARDQLARAGFDFDLAFAVARGAGGDIGSGAVKAVGGFAVAFGADEDQRACVAWAIGAAPEGSAAGAVAAEEAASDGGRETKPRRSFSFR